MINIGAAILLVAMSYFGFTYGFSWWIDALMVLAVITWGYYGFSDERNAVFKAKVCLYEAKADYYRRKEATMQ